MLSNRLTLCSPLFFFSSIFPSIGGFSNESALHIRWPKYWSFSFRISPSDEYSGLIFFRIDWFDFVVLQETQKFSLAPQFENISSSVLCLLYGPALTSVHDYWKDHQSVSSVTQLCLTLCDPVDCSTAGFPVHHHLPLFTQTHVH